MSQHDFFLKKRINQTQQINPPLPKQPSTSPKELNATKM